MKHIYIYPIQRRIYLCQFILILSLDEKTMSWVWAKGLAVLFTFSASSD